MRLGKTTIKTEATTTHGERNENETQLENEIGKWAMRTITKTKTTAITKQLVETPSEVRSKQSEAKRIQILAYIHEYIYLYIWITIYVNHYLIDNERLQRIV